MDPGVLNWIAALAFTGLSALAGGRLLLLWRETRKLPELLIAVLILGVGTTAVGGGFVVRTLFTEGPLLHATAFVPLLGADIGMAALLVFTWRVYRPGSRFAAAAVLASIGVMIALVGYAALHGSARALESERLSLIGSSIYVGTMGWSAAEAFHYWGRLRRRLPLGLADPLVTNRVLLWGIATATAGIGISIGTAARHLGGIVEFQHSWVTLCYAGHGLLSAIAFWLAFKPPAAYARWVVTSVQAKQAF